ncbi:MAG: RluA family pseudouridine synthase [Cytophagaceae bacterium]
MNTFNHSRYFSVEYEDNHLIVVNKKSGVLVQGDKTGDIPLADHVKAYLKEKYNKPGNVFAGVVHRIDRPVTGLVLLARTSKALERMNEQFKSRTISKTYWAVVKKRPAEMEGRLVHWLVKDERKNTSTAHSKEVAGSLKAELSYKVLGHLQDHYLLEVKPITGRPHQIRVQLAQLGCPIRGDVKYGFPKPNEDGSINLHARKLEFLHPVKKEPVTVIGNLPEDHFWQQFLTFGKKDSE